MNASSNTMHQPQAHVDSSWQDASMPKTSSSHAGHGQMGSVRAGLDKDVDMQEQGSRKRGSKVANAAKWIGNLLQQFNRDG